MSDLFENSTAVAKEEYSARDIEVLEGLEPVRHRPGMYIGGTDEQALHHLVAEILDNSMDEAVALEGAKNDVLRRVTFNSAAYVSKTPASEHVISGAVESLEEGAFSGPIKGNGGVYFLQVEKKNTGVATFDAAAEQKTLETAATRNINGQTILNELYRKGNVEDSRYLFF
jgi:topoisomerase-4 subunit B